MNTLNNTPSSIFEHIDRCPSCGSPCNFDDLDSNDNCNDCRIGKLHLIVAVAENLTIGKDNDLPWKLPTDLKNFKEVTSGSIVVMGRKCYDSIGRPLPKRENVVITRDPNLKIDGCVVLNSLNEMMSMYKDDPRKIFIIGGSEIYKQTFEFAHKIYLTEVIGNVDGDVKLVGMDLSKRNLIYQSEIISENGYQFRFKEYI
jgi:dihydrofolate reductase